MATLKLVSISEDKVIVNVHEIFDKKRMRGYKTDVCFVKGGDNKWIAQLEIADMQPQESFEIAAQKVGQYLFALNEAVSKADLTIFNPEELFSPKHYRDEES